jgi:hypothetical protein
MAKSSFGSILSLPHLCSAGFLLCLLLPLFASFSCKKDKPVLSSSAEITLSSKLIGNQTYYSVGYSFEKQDFFQRTGSSSDIDIYLVRLLKPSGELTGVQFSTNSISESTYGFYLNGEFDSMTAAEEYYKNYTVANAPEYVTLTDTIEKYQVYTFRTWKSNYVKFLVKDLRVINAGDIPDYFEVDIEYFIQRDGSLNLVN